MGSFQTLTIGHVLILLLLSAYFMPSVIAFARKHQNKAAIMVVNVFLGWTFLGWVASLAWSLTNVNNRSAS